MAALDRLLEVAGCDCVQFEIELACHVEIIPEEMSELFGTEEHVGRVTAVLAEALPAK